MSQVLTSQYPLFVDGVQDSQELIDVGSAAKLMEWFYRVKTWRHTIDLYYDGGATPMTFNGVYDYRARGDYLNDVLTNTLPANERFLVLDKILQPNPFNSFVSWVQFAAPGGEALDLLVLRFYYLSVVDGVQTGWFPEIVLIGGSPTVGSSPLSADPNLIDAVPANATLTVDGFNVPLWEIDPSPGALTWTGSYDLSPIEWWPYAPTSGGLPVFDSATGAQINPNVVID